MQERLQKIMANAGIASRRKSEELISQGKVMVNGHIITQLGTKVDPYLDVIKVNGKTIRRNNKKVYYILYKPRKILSTVTDDRKRKTVIDLLKNVEERIFPVGRLDYDSEGLVFLTNDGWIANRLMHPRYQKRKLYLVELQGEITDQAVDQLRNGVELEDGITSPAYVEILQRNQDRSILKIGITEGRNRQIRRMCASMDFLVNRLIRTQIGPLKLGKLKVGEFRKLTPQEISKLKQVVSGT